MLSGSVLSGRCLPAGASRHPFGSSIVPSVDTPGRAVGRVGVVYARVTRIDPITASHSAPPPRATLRIVVDETTRCDIKRLFGPSVRDYTGARSEINGTESMAPSEAPVGLPITKRKSDVRNSAIEPTFHTIGVMEAIAHHMFALGVPVAEKILRTVIVYVALIVGLRL